MNHYETLGVNSDAEPAEIKKAYKRQAHKHHPDREDGDSEAFHRVARAYEVLSDPGRRERYDRTGEDGPTPTIDDIAMNTLAAYFDEVITRVEFDGDLVKKARDRFKGRRYENKLDKEREEKKLSKLQKHIDRVSARGDNLFRQVLKGRIDAIKQSIDDADHNDQVLARVDELLSDYEDVRPQEQYQSQATVFQKEWFERTRGGFFGTGGFGP